MGNLPQLDALVREHLPAALRFAMRLVGNATDAEEIVQEALLRVVRTWRTFRGEAEFRTWLFRILINVSRDRARAASRDMRTTQTVEAPAPADDPAQQAMAAELESAVAEEIVRLPPRQREVLVLMVYETLTAREVAQIVGISESNVYATLSLARTRLRTKLSRFLGSIEL